MPTETPAQYHARVAYIPSSAQTPLNLPKMTTVVINRDPTRPANQVR